MKLFMRQYFNLTVQNILYSIGFYTVYDYNLKQYFICNI